MSAKLYRWCATDTTTGFTTTSQDWVPSSTSLADFIADRVLGHWHQEVPESINLTVTLVETEPTIGS